MRGSVNGVSVASKYAVCYNDGGIRKAAQASAFEDAARPLMTL